MILPSVPPQHYATLPPHVWASFSLQKLDKIEAEVRKTWIDVWSDICLMIIANERLSPVRKLSKLRGHTVEVARQKQDELQTQGRRVTVNTDHCARVSWTTAGELCEREPDTSIYARAAQADAEIQAERVVRIKQLEMEAQLLRGQLQTTGQTLDEVRKHAKQQDELFTARVTSHNARVRELEGQLSAAGRGMARLVDDAKERAEAYERLRDELKKQTARADNAEGLAEAGATVRDLRAQVDGLQSELAGRPSHLALGAAIKALQAENDRLKALSAKQTSV